MEHVVPALGPQKEKRNEKAKHSVWCRAFGLNTLLLSTRQISEKKINWFLAGALSPNTHKAEIQLQPGLNIKSKFVQFHYFHFETESFPPEFLQAVMMMHFTDYMAFFFPDDLL